MDFYSAISTHYNEIFPVNKAQLSFIKSCITEHTKKNLLDIGCGTGGLPINLYNDFNSISAIDTNKKMLEIAQESAENMSIDFRAISMLEIDYYYDNHVFDVVVCFGNTLVHLQNKDEITTFFMKSKMLLKPFGKLLFQIINYDNIIENNIKGLPTIENTHIKFTRQYDADNEGRIDFNTELLIKETGEKLNNTVKLLPIRKAELEIALKDAGFSTIKSYSSFKKDSYNPLSLPLIIECY
jgi:2-polyprenyl-3-methyl-5-hydroxy-6-metoxy-1,4-benzoquinol methylase